MCNRQSRAKFQAPGKRRGSSCCILGASFSCPRLPHRELFDPTASSAWRCAKAPIRFSILSSFTYITSVPFNFMKNDRKMQHLEGRAYAVKFRDDEADSGGGGGGGGIGDHFQGINPLLI